MHCFLRLFRRAAGIEVLSIICTWHGDVIIEDGAKVGIGSTVAKNVPAYTVAAGKPARVIKQYDFQKYNGCGYESYRRKFK
jgi:serine acetyltransferase